MNFYVKENNRYKRIYDTPRLYADGVWLVKNNQCSASCILKLGELKELYPFAQMMQSHEKLSTWITYKGQSEILGSLGVIGKQGGFSYCFKSSSDIGKDILRFLALSPEEQDAEIKELQSQTLVDSEGAVRDKTGMLIHSRYSRKAAEAQIAEKEAEIKKIKEQLSLIA